MGLTFKVQHGFRVPLVCSFKTTKHGHSLKTTEQGGCLQNHKGIYTHLGLQIPGAAEAAGLCGDDTACQLEMAAKFAPEMRLDKDGVTALGFWASGLLGFWAQGPENREGRGKGGEGWGGEGAGGGEGGVGSTRRFDFYPPFGPAIGSMETASKLIRGEIQ